MHTETILIIKRFDFIVLHSLPLLLLLSQHEVSGQFQLHELFHKISTAVDLNQISV